MNSGNRISAFCLVFLSCILLSSEAHPQWLKQFDVPGKQIYGRSVQESSDGGYVIAGYTNAVGAGGHDFLLMKITSTGAIEWQKTFGGSLDEFAYSLAKTYDSKYGHGYIVTGETKSFGAGNSDFLLIKLLADGSVQWKKTIGGSSWDMPYAIQQTADEGYIVAGRTASSGAVLGDVLVIKLYNSGVIHWQKTYGGSLYDEAYSIYQTSDSGYILAGKTNSMGSGSYDFLVMKLSSSGSLEWTKTYGGVHNDEARSIQQTSDGGYIVAGFSYASSTGTEDIVVLKLSSTGSIQWKSTFGTDWVMTDDDQAHSVQQTSDGGYVVGGHVDSSDHLAVIKLNSAGATQWTKRLFRDGAEGYSIRQTSSGGYILVGEITTDLIAMKLGPDGNIPNCPDLRDWALENPFIPISDFFQTFSQSTPSLSEGNPAIIATSVSVPVVTICGSGGGCGATSAEAASLQSGDYSSILSLTLYVLLALISVGMVAASRWKSRNSDLK